MASPNNGQPVPPVGYKLDADPPAGYVLDADYSSVPAFLQQGLDMNKVQQVVTTPQTEEDRQSTAAVDSSQPYTIKVLAPDLYGPPILNHELTHTYQDTRSQGISPSSPITQSGRAAYDYGGIQGLQSAIANRKTVSDFNAEQQAEMVKDYKFYHDQYLTKAAQGKITPADEKKMYALQQAYHPFIRQLADMPGQQENLQRNPLLELLGVQKPATINARPTTPGLPPYDTPGLGVLPADKLMGGKSEATAKPVVTYDTGPLKGKPVPHLLEQGNVDVNHRPSITNADGSKSSIFSVTVPLDKDGEVWRGDFDKAPKYALVPSIVNGKFLSPDGKMPLYANKDPKTLTPEQKKIREKNLGQLEDRVRNYYEQKHEHLGIFSSSQAADKYAGLTHAYGPDGSDKKVYTPSYSQER